MTVGSCCRFPRGDVDVSAVCQYQIGDVKKVFEGVYKEYREASQRWGRYSGAIPFPRPGSVRNSNGVLVYVCGCREEERWFTAVLSLSPSSSPSPSLPPVHH